MGKSWLPVVAIVAAVVFGAVPAALSWPLASTVSAATDAVGVSNLPPRTGVWPVNVTLYGNAGLGWGFNASGMTQPGPTVTVYRGDTVNLTLVATDAGVTHDWFIDFNNDLQPNPGEPRSPPFVSGSPVVWSFPADGGNWTYRCSFHPTTMFGRLVVRPEPRPVSFTFHGNAGRGWGFSNATIREPGPPLVVLWGTNVSLTLVANDSANHTWFIDFDNSLTPSSGEPNSPVFGPRNAVVWTFPANAAGNWTYRCEMHPTTMTGNLTILGGPPFRPPRPVALPLITTIMVGTLGFVFVFAVVYHVRAVRASKRMK